MPQLWHNASARDDITSVKKIARRDTYSKSMQSFSSSSIHRDSGFFHAWVSASALEEFFLDGTERAFFISMLQDLLSNVSSQHSTIPSFTKDIDLLAYSLSRTGVHLLVYAQSKIALESLGQTLLIRYTEYLSTHSLRRKLPFDGIFIFDHLTGRHEALGVSKEIHQIHKNWRTEQYSSIGFYLDDRRGDWMRPYRLTNIYHNQPALYLAYLYSRETAPDRIFSYLGV